MVELAQFAFGFVFVLHEVCCGGADYMVGFVSKWFCPLLAPVVYVGGVLRPLEAGCEGFFYVGGFEFGVVAVPAEDAQGWGFVGVGVLAEVGE